MRCVYTVWFRDPALEETDPDVEWPACFLVEAATARLAQEWGDWLARRYAHGSNQRVVRSSTEDHETCGLPGIDALPLVRDGEEATDEEIGW